MRFVTEFKEFALRGTVVDTAVGIVIGVAFGKIVTSLVEDVFGPVVGVLTKSADFSSWSIKVPDPQNLAITLVEVPYGRTVTSLMNFVIVTFCAFLVVKAMIALKRGTGASMDAPKQELLLAEIRDLLKERSHL